MKKTAVIFCLFIFFIQFFQILYFKNNLFTEKYDATYWKDRYEHSQYQLPLSKRIIGDDGLFAYSGYRLINGDNPFSINNDKPPVAKYFFGLSILLFNNPLHITLFFGLVTLLIFYFLARQLLKDNNLALFVTAILFLDPLFFSQFWITGLDLIQLSFLLLNILLLLKVEKTQKRNIFIALGSGLSLGLFAEVKPPILLPIIFVLESILLLYKSFKKEYLFFVLGFLLGIILPYLRFLYLGNGMVDILRIHKFMASIYLQSQLQAHVGAIWWALMFGKFPNITSGSFMNISEWWVLWPVAALLGIAVAIFSLFSKKIDVSYKGISIFLLIALTIFTFIPSYPRYLVIILPFLYIFGAKFVQIFFSRRKITLLLALLLIYGIFNSLFFLFPKPDTSLNGFYYNLSHLYFHDIYQENIANPKVLKLTRDQFRGISNKALENAQVQQIEIKELSRSISLLASEGNVKARITYRTQNLGSFYEDKLIKLVKINGSWKIQWDWNIIFEKFLPEYSLESKITIGKRGSIINSNGAYMAKDIDGYLLSVDPEKIDLKREQDMLKIFPNYGYKGDVYFQNAYLENVLPGTYVPLFTISQYISQKERDDFLSYPGLILTPYVSRVFANIDPKSIDNTFYNECCTRIYSSYSYHGIKGLEKKFDNVLWGYSGGKILMKNNGGTIIRMVYSKEGKDGKDIVLNN